MLTGSVFITGGAGFLGRAILRRAQRDNWPATFTVYSRDEEKQHKLRDTYPDVRCILGDVRNLERLIIAMQGHETVIHASAVKFVPEAEYNVIETIEVNVQGSINVALAARAAQVRTVIGVSTDKACSPVNLYGITKAAMERLFGEADGWSDQTAFIVTRYGNVVGSTGSIVPVFRRQLERDGRVTVTDPGMTRFWLSPDDAVDLIHRCYLARDVLRGRILIPAPGAMTIGELARIIAGEAPIKEIGARPGEKKHEALISEYEADRAEETADGYIINPTTGRKDLDSFGIHIVVPPQTSDRPRHWIEAPTMAAMIADAETL